MDDRPEKLNIGKEDWERTPAPIRKAFELLLQENQQLRMQIQDLES